MSVLDRILAVFAPYECLGCQAEGNLLCAACIERVPFSAGCCYRCQTPTNGSRTCADCSQTTSLLRVQARADYSGPAKELISRLKFAGAQSAARQMADQLLSFVAQDCPVLIVPVPTATGRVRSRGYDQAKVLARILSRQSRQPYVNCLVRIGQTHQVGANREQRLRQLQQAFLVRKPKLVQNAHIVLIDDVVTTGATLEMAAKALKNAGAKQIEAVTFCRA